MTDRWATRRRHGGCFMGRVSPVLMRCVTKLVRPRSSSFRDMARLCRPLCCVNKCVEPLSAAFAGLSWLTRGHLPCTFLGHAGAHASDAGRGVTACLLLKLYSCPVSQDHIVRPEVHAPHHDVQEICAQDARDHQLLHHHNRERPLPSPQVQLNDPQPKVAIFRPSPSCIGLAGPRNFRHEVALSHTCLGITETTAPLSTNNEISMFSILPGTVSTLPVCGLMVAVVLSAGRLEVVAGITLAATRRCGQSRRK
ncbi:hypothetical protein T08_14631 [Trichinella sp. T8]|nr:hypothetical protein T08_14631 [Trichinella sp. T8]